MPKLKPSARSKKRYLLIRGNEKSVKRAILEYVGILGYAKSAPVFVKKKEGTVVLAIERSEIDKVIGSFAIASDKIQVLKVSGTLKGLEKK